LRLCSNSFSMAVIEKPMSSSAFSGNESIFGYPGVIQPGHGFRSSEDYRERYL
jgi:hypothetical protein